MFRLKTHHNTIMKASLRLYPLLVAALAIPSGAFGQHAYESSKGYYEYGGSSSSGGRSAGRDGWTAHAAAEWVSRYLQRGYQQFGNAGAFGIMLGGGYGPVAVGVEQRFADSSADREFRGTLSASHDIEGLEIGTRATYMSDLRGGPSNWDLGFGVGGELVAGIRWESEIYYGTEPKNFYVDAGLSREWSFTSTWNLRAAAGMGFNLGYQRDARKGADHAQLGLDIARSLSSQSSIYGGVGYNAAINRDALKYADHSDLYDGFVFRIGARWEY